MLFKRPYMLQFIIKKNNGPLRADSVQIVICVFIVLYQCIHKQFYRQYQQVYKY